MKLKDKVIIITGAARGLGAAMSATCAAEGARVVCGDLAVPELHESVNRIRELKGIAHGVLCDVAKMDDLRRIVDEAVATFGRIDGLINNAGVNYVKPFVEVTEKEWDHVINVDLKGSFFLSQLCVRQMLKQNPVSGSIVQIASVHTQASVAGASPYDAAKHGMVGFSKAAAVELARHKIRINILSPGLCQTEIWKDIVAAAPNEKECRDYWNSNIPAARLIQPDEIAACCVFLLSDASSAITGSNIMADLGMTSLLVSAEPYQSRAISSS
jgi:A-factor type gamma-butyrolactone 1'-reductase (1S-forming)